MIAEHRARAQFLPHKLLVEALACRRGERLLFSGLSFAVHPGEVLALRGQNGAGKTTLLMALAGAMRPESGAIVIEGADPERPTANALGFLGHQSALKGRLTVAENLQFWAAINGALPRTQATLERVGLAPIAGLAAAGLSAGQTRRLALARLIISERPIWLLDEPTAALDANGERLIGDLLDEHLERGGLVVAATHHDLPVSVPGRLKTLQIGKVMP